MIYKVVFPEGRYFLIRAADEDTARREGVRRWKDELEYELAGPGPDPVPSKVTHVQSRGSLTILGSGWDTVEARDLPTD